MRHKGQPNLSLLGGPCADITPANLLNKLVSRWTEEAQTQIASSCNIPGTPSTFVTPTKTLLGTASSVTTATDSYMTAASDSSRNSKGLVPSAEAISMANTGCNAVPGMTAAAYREALYSTWTIGRPWGMQFFAASDEVCACLTLSLNAYMVVMLPLYCTCLSMV